MHKAEIGEALEQQPYRKAHLLACEKPARAEMMAEAEGGMVAFVAVDVEAVGIGKAALVAACRRDEGGHRCTGRDRHAAKLDRPRRLPCLGADRRDPAQALVNRFGHEGLGIGEHLPHLFGMGQQAGDDRAGAMSGLLHAAEQDHLDARHQEVDWPRRALRHAVMQHMRQRGIIRCVDKPFQRRQDGVANLGADRVGDLLPLRVVLEIDGALGKAVEPAAQRRHLDVGKAERARQAERRHRLEIVGH
ncbi:hypothetical protein X734_12830 [Mesorhizobium sp. L2C084A000]|nr:hypothetical protein X734_12830 [Mesorhizobium sp. L2C084A000]